MDDELFGRLPELAQLAAFMRTADRSSCALLLDGPAGVGKTVLWRAAVAMADTSRLVLQARPAEAEAKLAYGGLADLLGGAAETVLGDLPEPQRVGLEATLLLRSAEAPSDPRLLGAAVLGALRTLAERSPLLIAVDDLQWLDTSSASTLAYAIRRLRDDEPIGCLFTRRSDATRTVAIPTPPGGLVQVDVGPLSFEAIAELLARSFPGRMSRPTARRIWAASGGNPLYALELATAIDRERGPIDPAHPLPVSRDLEALLSERLSLLPDTCRNALLATALLSGPTRRLVGNAVEIGGDEGIDAAMAAGVLEEERGRLRFAHPLFASAVASLAGLEARNTTHRRLAEVVGEPERAALHLALASQEPDAVIARALDDASSRALARGAPSEAAEYAEQALRLTDRLRVEEVTNRMLSAGRLRVLAGDHVPGVALLEEAVARLEPGPQRALALCSLTEGASHDPARAAGAIAQALEDAADDPAVKARVLGVHSIMAFITMDNLQAAERDTAEALSIAEATGEPELIVQTLASSAWVGIMRGRSPEGLVGRAQQFPELLERWPLFWFPERAQLFWHLRRGEHAAARSRLLELKSRAIDVGQEEAVSVYAFHLADLETGAGRWEQAAAHAAELSAFADWTPQAQPVALSAEAKLAACLGDVERARELAERGIEHAIQLGSLVFAMENQAALALAAMAVGDAAAAVAAAEHHWQSVATSGLLSPGMVSSLPDYVESLIALGRLDEAEEPLCWLEARSAEQNHPWGLMVSARCRGIAAAAQGDQDRSRGAFATALEPRPGVTLPLEEARTLLAQGVALRRGKHRQAARDSLTRALERFTGLGATAFAERASEELARIGGRRPQFAHELTPSQQRVAELIAKGASNKEIAASLFISEHTVESHLRQIYMKLGVSSRVQLTLHLLRD